MRLRPRHRQNGLARGAYGPFVEADLVVAGVGGEDVDMVPETFAERRAFAAVLGEADFFALAQEVGFAAAVDYALAVVVGRGLGG